MNLSQLNYFKKLAEVLHYTRAAQELFITQPTLSGAISSLEKELGAPLFERDGRTVLLTPYGEVFYEHVCLALRAIDDGVAAVSARSSASFGTVNLGTTFTTQDRYMPELIKSFEEAFNRRVVVKVSQGFTNYLTEQLHRGTLDVAFCGRRDNESDIAYYPVKNCELALFVRNDHKLARAESVTFKDLEKVDLHTYRRGTPIGERVSQMLEDAGVQGVTLGFDDDVSMGSYASYNGGNVGVLMLDSLGAQLFNNLRMVRVEGIPEHFYTVYLAHHKKHVHSRAVSDFIEFVENYPGNDTFADARAASAPSLAPVPAAAAAPEVPAAKAMAPAKAQASAKASASAKGTCAKN